MTIAKNSKMMGLLNYRLRLTLADGRAMAGHMLAFDKHMNLVLSECEEFRSVKPKAQGAKASLIKRTLGLVILRGECIVSISVDGPPPSSAAASRQAKMALAAGPGVARPAGRGIPVPPPGVPPPGLAGPVRGMGGPAVAAGPITFPRPPPPPMAGAPPPGFRPPMPPPGFRPPMPPPGMGPQGFAPPGFQPPYSGPRPPPS
ncbi:Small nuclear ribonucleoprotein-associated protein B [Coemansia sp. RSA 1290]|nr:small nuclear ribonucleoprotein [Coemansia mojavensis]KAJ1873619.1 Small nuclear ribonucleoprotein-associated protein B [Coemansia sp. RSA 990]KAJ2631693.1 Small nuclear ribonucleoprotein-associated protein B [Coemansia sp. RSA 1290]KAJ2648727.1 Small nuclear ribonucleoprotein-associated protein B [Coemansia sp. RSA 1250]KAJ2671080.1 Small nuclear ribonucleoprotein-associated protein B [Coemansia sp. RSA 1085]